jgi:hypothetical protein
LKTVVVDKSRLRRMELLTVDETLDRCDRLGVMHCSKRQARVDATTVQQHRACAALAMIAALLGSCQREMLTQSIEKGCTRIERQTMGLAVDSKFDTYRSHRPLGRRTPRRIA